MCRWITADRSRSVRTTPTRDWLASGLKLGTRKEKERKRFPRDGWWMVRNLSPGLVGLSRVLLRASSGVVVVEQLLLVAGEREVRARKRRRQHAFKERDWHTNEWMRKPTQSGMMTSYSLPHGPRVLGHQRGIVGIRGREGRGMGMGERKRCSDCGRWAPRP